MCAICGCSGDHVHDHQHQHDADHVHDHAHDHGHAHEHPHTHVPPHTHAQPHASHVRTLTLEADILGKNNALAERNRGWFAGRSVLALNLVSSPGSGKTTLLERTIRDTGSELDISVLGGDQETQNDAARIAATGCKVLQINTGTGCHLDAEMVGRGLRTLDPPMNSVLMIENVGNLVCPALFDLGELAKVAMLSVTEGEDKPAKYPHMFRASRLMLLTKIDLLPHLDFDVERCIAYALQVNPRIEVLQLSAKSGAGMDGWYGWLREQRALHQQEAVA